MFVPYHCRTKRCLIVEVSVSLYMHLDGWVLWELL
jgi:hypothetical protein